MGQLFPTPDGTAYSFYLEPREPRTTTVSDNRRRILEAFREKPRTFSELKRITREDNPFRAASQLLTLNATLGFGFHTDPRGRIVMEPHKGRRKLFDWDEQNKD